MALTAYKGWVCPDAPYKGKHRDEDGKGLCGFYAREFKKATEMVVMNNGNALLRYKYPKAEIPFRSPMSRWENLLFCGGYSVTGQDGSRTDSDQKLLEAVLQAKKPIGFIVGERGKLEKMKQRAEEAGYHCAMNPHFRDGWADLGVCGSGKAKDVFDMKAFFDSYRIMSDALEQELFWDLGEGWLKQQAKKDLTEFLSGWDYANPRLDEELALTGLLLGYPIESTVAAITSQIW